jgi:hypothetical protein
MPYVFDKVIEAQVAPTVTAGAYTAEDVVGGLLTFNITSPSGCGVINKLVITDDADQKAAGSLYLFNAAPTAIADNAAGELAIADLKKIATVIAIAADDYKTVNNNAYAVITDINDVYKADGKGCLYGYFITSGTPTYAAITDLTLTLSVLTS